ncbi:Copia protein [Ooceraea biroi]|uniref:Copia protein n=1 Tax=Ooceraea biroi TaxID=2015173 RepID=A0A026WA12_OOCBI|nr:Copia protein [Ooceraea biroi]
MARTMLLDAGLSKRYWAEAASTATYILNRCPTTPLTDKTPEELWTGKRPDLRHCVFLDAKP